MAALTPGRPSSRAVYRRGLEVGAVTSETSSGRLSKDGLWRPWDGGEWMPSESAQRKRQDLDDQKVPGTGSSATSA